MKFEAARRTARPAGKPGPMQDVFLPGSSPIFTHLQSGFYPPSEVPHFPRTLPCLRASSIPRCDRYGSSSAHPPWAAPSEKPQPALARRPASGVREMKNTRDPQRVSFCIFQPECVIIRTSDFTNEGIEESRKHVLAGGAAIRGRQWARIVAGVCSSAATAEL